MTLGSSDRPVGAMRTDPGQTVDWNSARAYLVSAVRQRWYHEDAPIDEMVQDGLVRALRASRRAPIRNVEAFLTEIAKRVVFDELRRRTRSAALFAPEAEGGYARAAPVERASVEFGDPVARVRFVILNFFGQTACGELARFFFREMNWKQVAGQQGRSHAAVRKQWERCVSLLREAVRTDPTLAALSDWAAAEGGDS